MGCPGADTAFVPDAGKLSAAVEGLAKLIYGYSGDRPWEGEMVVVKRDFREAARYLIGHSDRVREFFQEADIALGL